MKLLNIMAISVALALPTPVLAQDATKPHRERSEEVGDGSRMICRTSGVTGSRVKTGRICMTADEWATSKREARQKVEMEQQRRPLAE